MHLAGTRSPWADVRYGIPQGSVLGPVLYVLYTADIAKIIESLGFQVHLYADDVQLYASCVPTDSVQLSQRVLLAIETIGTWMSSNRLRLNPDKTQYIWFGTRQRLKNRDIRGLTALSSSLVETSSVRDLGVILDSETDDGGARHQAVPDVFPPSPSHTFSQALPHQSSVELSRARVHFVANRLSVTVYCAASAVT